MTDTQTLDTAAVAAWLDETLGIPGPVTAEKFAGGQSNPTFLLRHEGGTMVLRRKPPGVLLKSAHAVDREFRVQKALQDTDVPVARMLALCEDDGVIGSAFYVMEHVTGRNFDSPTLPELDRDDRRPVFDEMARVLAAIHEVDIEAVGLADYGPDGNYFRRQTDRWTKQYEASATEEIAEMDALGRWLDENMVADDGQRRLVHGDYRLDNMLFALDEARCVAVLDWELSTIGHPYADLASVLMQWQLPTTNRGLAGVDRAAEGLISDADFVASYCARRGIAPIDNLGFYLAFCFYRMAGILQGVKKRALDGNASNPERAMQMGAFVPVLAEAGLKAARG